MNSEGKFWFAIWTSVGIIFFGIMLTLSICELKIKTMFAENGYEQVMVKGSATYKWQKIERADE